MKLMPKLTRKLTAAGAVLLAATLVFGAAVRAQDYPSTPSTPSTAITLVTPLGPGTVIDILARLYGERLARRFGRQVIVSNRPGAGGLIAAQAVARAPADGATLLAANSGHAILGTLNKNLPFDPVRDFAGITLVGETASVVVVPPSLGIRTLKALVALARAKPGTINYGSNGIGTAGHLAGAYFALQAGIVMVHVPYRTGSALIADLVAGRIQAAFVPAAFTLPMLQDGKLLALAVSAREPMRNPIAVPAAPSAGIDYEYATWYGFLAPAKTPTAVLQTLDRVIADIGEDAELQAKIVAQGIAPRNVGLRDFDAHIRREMARLDPLLKSIGKEIGN
jgi:tripartite-type tricarboxylate transporter receptor subunit TctC